MCGDFEGRVNGGGCVSKEMKNLLFFLSFSFFFSFFLQREKRDFGELGERVSSSWCREL